MDGFVVFVGKLGGRRGFAGINRVMRAARLVFDTETQRNGDTEDDRKMAERKVLTQRPTIRPWRMVPGRREEPRMTRMGRIWRRREEERNKHKGHKEHQGRRDGSVKV